MNPDELSADERLDLLNETYDALRRCPGRRPSTSSASSGPTAVPTAEQIACLRKLTHPLRARPHRAPSIVASQSVV